MQISAMEVPNNTRLNIVEEQPHKTRILPPEYKTAIYWATVDTYGKINEEDLQKWMVENGIDKWKYSFRSKEMEGVEITPGIVCECAVFFDNNDMFNKVITAESGFHIEGEEFFRDCKVYTDALHEQECVWREERGLPPLTEDEYNVDEDWD